MTLLRRAPREVYRVCGEQEFLASEEELFTCAVRDERFELATSGIGGRRLHRVAGATMLLAVIGAVGGLIAIASLTSVAGDRRRVGAGLLAASASLVSSRAARGRVWPEPAGSDASRHQSAQSQVDRRSAQDEADRPQDEADRRNAQDRRVDRARGVRHASVVPVRAAVVAVVHSSAPTEATAPASVSRLTASAASQSRQSGQSEFGFER
jgi:hypothetical protein